jgi:hypothetical protein
MVKDQVEACRVDVLAIDWIEPGLDVFAHLVDVTD